MPHPHPSPTAPPPPRFGPHDWLLAFLLALATIQTARADFFVNDTFLDWRQYALGHAPLPYQGRAALVPLLRWAGDNPTFRHLADRYAVTVQIGTLYYEPVTPEKFMSLLLGLLSLAALMLAAFWWSRRRALSPWWLPNLLVLFITAVTVALRSTTNYWYAYDLPHAALFGIGALLALEGWWAPALLCFALDIPLRETSLFSILMLAPVFFVQNAVISTEGDATRPRSGETPVFAAHKTAVISTEGDAARPRSGETPVFAAHKTAVISTEGDAARPRSGETPVFAAHKTAVISTEGDAARPRSGETPVFAAHKTAVISTEGDATRPRSGETPVFAAAQAHNPQPATTPLTLVEPSHPTSPHPPLVVLPQGPASPPTEALRTLLAPANRPALLRTAALVAAMGLVWAVIRLLIHRRYAANLNLTYPRLSQNLHEILFPHHWPQLFSAGGYLPLLVWLDRRSLPLPERALLFGCVACIPITLWFGVWTETRVWLEWTLPLAALASLQAIHWLQTRSPTPQTATPTP